eukprot:615285-Prorocentrum_lima.AAC.1
MLISQLQGRANMYMQTDMDKDPNVAELFQYGGFSTYDSGATCFEGSGIQHILLRLGKYFREHSQSEVLRVATEYTNFARRSGEAIEIAIARSPWHRAFMSIVQQTWHSR